MTIIESECGLAKSGYNTLLVQIWICEPADLLWKIEDSCSYTCSRHVWQIALALSPWFIAILCWDDWHSGLLSNVYFLCHVWRVFIRQLCKRNVTRGANSKQCHFWISGPQVPTGCLQWHVFGTHVWKCPPHSPFLFAPPMLLENRDSN